SPVRCSTPRRAPGCPSVQAKSSDDETLDGEHAQFGAAAVSDPGDPPQGGARMATCSKNSTRRSAIIVGIFAAASCAAAACDRGSDPDDGNHSGQYGVASGLVAAYSFEGSGSTVTDDSGNGNVGTLSGATWAAGGRFGQALSFDGQGAWVTIADAASLDLTTGMTVEAWVKPTKLDAYDAIVVKEQPSELSYALYATNDASKRPHGTVFTNGKERQAVGPTTIPRGAWT